MGRRGHGWGGRAAAMPWVDLTSVTLMAFVSLPSQMSLSPNSTPLSLRYGIDSHTQPPTHYQKLEYENLSKIEGMQQKKRK